jgi:hypothetical protein
MKTKIFLKKLSLKKQTISRLTDSQMQGVYVGNITDDISFPPRTSIDVICVPVPPTKTIPSIQTNCVTYCVDLSCHDFTCH